MLSRLQAASRQPCKPGGSTQAKDVSNDVSDGGSGSGWDFATLAIQEAKDLRFLEVQGRTVPAPTAYLYRLSNVTSCHLIVSLGALPGRTNYYYGLTAARDQDSA